MDTRGVRFANEDDIAPDQIVEDDNNPSLEPIQTITHLNQRDDHLNDAAKEELQQLKTTLKNNMQSARAQHHAFEPVSLPGSQPASRVGHGLTHAQSFWC